MHLQITRGGYTVTVVDHQIRLLHEITAYPESSYSLLMYLFDVDRTVQVSMTKHAETGERICNLLGKKYTTGLGWDIGERVSHAANDQVLEDRGPLHKS